MWHNFCITVTKANYMKTRTIRYFSKHRALKILERPTQVDLYTLLNATFALSRNEVVKKHIQNTLHELGGSLYRLTA